jgi:hypothetical protein
MNTRTLLNLLLVCVALLLVLVIVYRPGLEQTPVVAPLTPLHANSIHTIRVTRKERMPLRFEKTASGWQLTGEHSLPASEFQLRALLGILDTRPDRSYPDVALDLAAAGLEPPQATLLLNDTVIDIGNTEALQHKRYIRLDDTVYLVTDKFQHLINADWSNFVERRLLPENATLTGLELPGTRLTRGEDGRWQASPPASGKDAAILEALIAQWQAATATYLRRDDGKATGTAITLELAGHRDPIRLYLLEQETELILVRPDWGLQYHFPASLRNALLDLPVPDSNLDLDARQHGGAPPQDSTPRAAP